MNTNPQEPQSSNDDAPPKRTEDKAEAIVRLLEELNNVDENAEDAQINKYSIDDNNGGRIEL